MSERHDLVVLVVDDEPNARETVVELLEEDPEIGRILEAADGDEAARAIESIRPDLVVLDVQMPETDGLELIERVGTDAMPPVVFVTAYDRYAVRAFESEALDYLLKPFDDERFREAMDRAKRWIDRSRAEDLVRRLDALLASRRAEHETAEGGGLDRVAVHAPDRVRFVRTDRIEWIAAAEGRAELHAEGEVHPVRYTLTELEDRLDPARFVRVHRSTIVNIEAIEEVQPWFHGGWVVVMRDGTTLRVSRRRRDDLERALGASL